ncbi:MAG: nucleoside:proton symporter [Alphaproteobacteria bacterium]|nr:nucleoside:proton symporter [Alphaproteobacteria bacterium]
MDQLQSLAGLLGLAGVAWLFSEKRGKVSLRLILAGLGVQIALAALLLKFPGVKSVFAALGSGVSALQEATRAGTSFVFGYLGGGALPFAESQVGSSFVLAFQALPLVLLMSALSALLYHWRILPLVVKGFSFLLEKSLRVGGAVGVSSAANAFLGMVEAPLLIRPYIDRLSRGELFVVMTGGMATIAGTVMVLYATFLEAVIPDAIGHLLVASLISVPAAVLVGKVMVPDEGKTEDIAGPPERLYAGSMDAISKGTQDGIGLLLNITAMLIVLVGLVHLANAVLGLLPDVAGSALSLERIFSWPMVPLVWLMGIPASDVMQAARLMGVKTVLNELLAYLQMAHLPVGALSERSKLLMTYGMCGFANFGSLGIMIGGLGALAPARRGEIVELGMKSILSGTLASLMTGAVVGLLI